ncbi:MAG: hypothetical protein KGS61_04505 [Verrucomicrobia bacterium]|nr:hypothetical protein [Verrucomicrobiota bacterium]
MRTVRILAVAAILGLLVAGGVVAAAERRQPNFVIIFTDDQHFLTHPTTAKTPHRAYFYYWNRELEAVRSGDWKLHFHPTYLTPDPPGHGGRPGRNARREIQVSLFNLQEDIGEIRNVAAWHPVLVRRLEGQ